ncbi:MAG: hypothetical protein V1911_01380 [Candidatus Micrarchaeota archaeon]
MDVKLAIEKAEVSEEVVQLRKNGYFLNSAFAVLGPEADKVEKWSLTYFNKEKNDTVEIKADANGVEKGVQGKPANPTKKELKLAQIKTGADEALAKARGEFNKKTEPLAQIIITLQNEEPAAWKFNFITKSMFIVKVEISAETGEINQIKKDTLIKIEKGGAGAESSAGAEPATDAAGPQKEN